jgi:Mimiviridae putative ATP-dependent RNA helicase
MLEYKTYLNNNGYNIALKYLTAKQIKKIEKDLTVAPVIRKATLEEIRAAEFPLYNYSEEGDSIIVPRYYGVSRFGEPDHVNFEEAEEIDIEFTKTLRDKQQAVVNLCIKYMLKNGGGLLSVPCGFGKTVCALYIAAALGLKTLVVVHKSFLLNQWIERAVEFLNIRRESIGVIRQSKCDIIGKDIVIGVIHTMSKKPYNELYRQFGLVIYDEAHHVGARYFSRTLMKTSCNYTLSLTATPYRNDGLIKVMYWFTGGTIYRESKKMNCNVIVKNITHSSTDGDMFRNKIKWFKGDFVANSQQMTYDMMEIEGRNKILIRTINHIRRNYPERNILVLSEKISHLNYLKEKVDQTIQDDIDAGLIEEDDVLSCYYIGDSKPHERQEAEERGDIIFASYQMASEGLDIKHLNTLIFASPKKDVVQTVGRIMRKILQAGDVRPMIIDIHDDLDIFTRWANLRKDYYQKCKYQIENYYMVDDEFVTGNRYYGLDSIEDDARERHNENMEIHKIINNRNYEYHEWKTKIREFEDLCSRYENCDIIRKNERNKRNRKIMKSLAATNIKKMRSTMFERDGSDTDSESKSLSCSNDELITTGGDLQFDIDSIYKTDNEIAEIYNLNDFENDNDLQVLEDFEPYKIADILRVDRLTVTDFTRNVLKSANVKDKINLEKDMHLDPDTDELCDEMMKHRGKSEQATFRAKLKMKRLV